MSLDNTAEVPPVRAQVRLSTASGSIRIMAEARQDVEVSTDRGVEHRSAFGPDAIGVGPSSSVELHCPIGSDVVVGTSAGSVSLLGRFGDVRVTTHSGSVSVDEVASADLRSTSGSVKVHRCEGTCRVRTTSGSVRVDEAVDADVSGGSGTVQVAGVTTRVRTVSGTIELAAGGDATVQTVSGNVSISVPERIHPKIVTRGVKRPKIEIDEGEDSLISVRSVSGSIAVRRR